MSIGRGFGANLEKKKATTDKLGIELVEIGDDVDSTTGIIERVLERYKE